MEEIWKKIPSFPKYEASSLGRIREHLQDGCYTMTAIYKNKVTGYCYVTIGHGRKNTINRYVHRLVADAFIGAIPDGYEIDHIDTIKDNNIASNLRIVTRSQNQRNPITNERIRRAAKRRQYSEATRAKMSAKRLGKKHTKESIALMSQKAMRFARKVIQYNMDGVFVSMFSSILEAVHKTGANKNGIIGCCRGRLKSSHNFIWRYADED